MSRQLAQKRRQSRQALGRSRGGFSTKIHIKTDLDGDPLGYHLTGGGANDGRHFELLLDIGPDLTPRAAVDNKSVIPMRPGQPEHVTHDYKRHGTTDLFATLDVKAGTVIGSCKGRHRAVEFRAFLDQVEAGVPADLDVHLVVDNAATHKTRLVHDGLVKHRRWHLHFTPTSTSWLNLVEGWFALLTRRRLQRGVFTSTADLEAAIHPYIEQTNANPKPFTWMKTADAVLPSVGRFCQRSSNSHQLPIERVANVQSMLDGTSNHEFGRELGCRSVHGRPQLKQRCAKKHQLRYHRFDVSLLLTSQCHLPPENRLVFIYFQD
jgi:transposase